MKPKRIVDKTLISALAGKPCIVCGNPGVGHHVKSVGAGGDDILSNLMVLCNRHHVEVHQMGKSEFAAKYEKAQEWLVENNWRYDSFMETWIRITNKGWDDELG